MTRIKNSSKEVRVCSAVHSGVTRQRISASRTLTICGNSFSQCVIRGTASSDGQQQLHFQHTLLKTRQLRNCIQAQKMLTVSSVSDLKSKPNLLASPTEAVNLHVSFVALAMKTGRSRLAGS